MELPVQIKDYLKEHEEEFKPWLVDKQQGRIDLKILPYLQDIENGIFIEAGALDGLFQSNTKILEDLGWQGLLIEPSKKAAQKCRENRKSFVLECALVSKDHKEDYIFGDFIFDGEDGQGAYSSINRKAYGILTSLKKKLRWQAFATKVHAKTLEFILDHYPFKRVDFLSLDVEGYELEVLKGINFDKIYIKYLLVEVNTKEYTLKEMENYLAQFNYDKGINLSNFTKDTPEWPGDHQDYLFICN